MGRAIKRERSNFCLEKRFNASSNPLGQYVWHPYYIDALAVRYYDEDTNGSADKHYYLQDANFNVTAVVDDAGDVLERYHYTPYGEEKEKKREEKGTFYFLEK